MRKRTEDEKFQKHETEAFVDRPFGLPVLDNNFACTEAVSNKNRPRVFRVVPL